MNGLLVRVGADQGEGGGGLNGPVDSRTGEFAYVPIPEVATIHPGMKRRYTTVAAAAERLGRVLPGNMLETAMHLDPDFDHLVVLLSRDFRCFGAEGQEQYKSKYPAIARAVKALGRGHRVNHLPELLRQLRELMREVWKL